MILTNYLLQFLLYGSTIQYLGIGEMGDGLCHGIIDGGRDFSEQGHELMPDLIATISQGAVGGVFHMSEAMKTGILFDFGSGKRQQRTDHISVARKDAMKTCETCASKEVEEESLGRIVAMMGRSNIVVVMLGAQLLEKLISQIACGLLY